MLFLFYNPAIPILLCIQQTYMYMWTKRQAQDCCQQLPNGKRPLLEIVPTHKTCVIWTKNTKRGNVYLRSKQLKANSLKI